MDGFDQSIREELEELLHKSEVKEGYTQKPEQDKSRIIRFLSKALALTIYALTLKYVAWDVFSLQISALSSYLIVLLWLLLK